MVSDEDRQIDRQLGITRIFLVQVRQFFFHQGTGIGRGPGSGRFEAVIQKTVEFEEKGQATIKFLKNLRKNVKFWLNMQKVPHLF